jgi:protein-disulfide isomerase
MKLSKKLNTPEGKSLLVLLVLIVALFGYYFYKTGGEPLPAPTIEVSQTDHVRGAQGAKVTIVEFGDFQCPACGMYEPIVQKVMADNKDIAQIVFRHFPLTQIHQNALLSAKAAEAAGEQGKFWEMHDLLYAKQKEWSNVLNARDFMLAYAKELNLNIDKFSADLKSSAIEDKIKAEYQEGMKLDVQGTPTFFVNGVKIENPQSVEAFSALIRAAAK